MSYTRKIKAGLVHEHPSQFVGQAGTIFYNNDNGQMFISDGHTPGGTAIGANANTGSLAFITNAMYNFDGIIIENADLTHGATAAITLPANGGTGSVYVNNTYGDVQLTAGINGATTSLQFTGTGLLNLPSVGGINQNNTWTKSVNSPLVNAGPGVVVWTSTQNYISSAKLTIQVECTETGDATGWHSQACEAIISCRGASNVGPTGDPQMTVYGVVHTSVGVLATFSAQRNLTTKMIEVMATLTAAAGSTAYIKVHSVELGTRD